jgi:hypothetical protein
VSAEPTKEGLAQMLREFPTWGHAAAHYKAELEAAHEEIQRLRTEGGEWSTRALVSERREKGLREALENLCALVRQELWFRSESPLADEIERAEALAAQRTEETGE